MPRHSSQPRSALKTTNPQTSYTRLIRDITTLYEQAQRALVVAYWQIGKRIVEEERQVAGNVVTMTVSYEMKRN